MPGTPGEKTKGSPLDPRHGGKVTKAGKPPTKPKPGANSLNHTTTGEPLFQRIFKGRVLDGNGVRVLPFHIEDQEHKAKTLAVMKAAHDAQNKLQDSHNKFILDSSVAGNDQVRLEAAKTAKAARDAAIQKELADKKAILQNN